ncbi:hypothetical protein H2203_004821 [Taxawa tesnikishii (nom. ined.)]|nr:hypothetical protein H2203_004821 [Dothideales sp. JES 119]
MDAAGSAMSQVLDTPELLEQILTYLPPLELLVLQRVSQLWNGTINASPELQRQLFMRPDWRLEAKAFDPWREINRPGERPKNNRMLRRVLGGSYPTVTLKVITSGVDPAPEADNDEMFIAMSELDQRPRRRSSGHWSWDVAISFPADKLPTNDPAIYHESASWRKMYLTQPPCTTLHLVRRWQRAARPAIECETGITMGEFVDRAIKAKEAWNELFIASDRDWHFEGPIKCSKYED